jgi:catechol 2,3-dioxygenase-like lactoylglutathione lyase family enzyme
MNMFGAAVAVAFVNVSDRDKGRAFYRDTLGLTLEAEDEFGEFYTFGAARLRLTPIPGHKGHDHPIAGWQVPDIAATAAALAARGVLLTIYPGMGQDEQGIWSTPDARMRVAWFNDPDGNCLSLNQDG